MRSMLKVEFSWFSMRWLRMPCCPLSPPQWTPVLRKLVRPCPFTVSKFAMQVSLASVCNSAICQSPAASRWNIMLSRMSVSATPPALCMAIANWNPLFASMEEVSSTILSSSISADRSKRCKCQVGWLSWPWMWRNFVLVTYRSYKPCQRLCYIEWRWWPSLFP